MLVAVFLGWMFAGMEMALMVPTARPAIQDFLSTGKLIGSATADKLVLIETMADKWFSWFLVAFLLGAACGGIAFGWVGDRAGRVRAMGWSILCYSAMTGLSYFVETPAQLLALRFLACFGIGGMWPCGVALAAEAWPSATRPMLAGLIGAAANVGFLVLGLIMLQHPVTRDSWRWVLLLGASPILLGLLVLASVPESPRWLEEGFGTTTVPLSPIREIFRPPLLRLTLLGIALGTIPLLGGWASGQRLVPWAGQIADQEALPRLKAITQTVWVVGAVLGSLVGGWLASRLGRRLSYFLISLGSLALSGYVFLALRPTDRAFLWTTFALGLVSTSFFGWLPYFLPDLFPTRVRATGTGVSYNFGRIFSAAAILASTGLIEIFGGDIARMGATTSLIYACGLVIVWFIPPDRDLEKRPFHKGQGAAFSPA